MDWRRLSCPGVQRRVDHAVQGGNPAVVGPARHQVADVDDEAVRHDGDVHPLAFGVEHLQAAGAVLGGQDGQAAVVRMRAGADLPGLRRFVPAPDSCATAAG